MTGVPLQVLLITSDGSKTLIGTLETKFKIGPIGKKVTKFDISTALVIDRMPSIDKKFPTAENLKLFDNATDLIRGNKFPKLYDTDLHLIVGIKEAELINFEVTRKPVKCTEP